MCRSHLYKKKKQELSFIFKCLEKHKHARAAVREALGRPVIIADRFHYCRYIYWALDKVRRDVQKEWHAYDRKKCKKMRHVFYKRPERFDHFKAKILLNLRYKI